MNKNQLLLRINQRNPHHRAHHRGPKYDFYESRAIRSYFCINCEVSFVGMHCQFFYRVKKLVG